MKEKASAFMKRALRYAKSGLGKVRIDYSKMGFYAALLALLVLLGSASRAFRSHLFGARTAEETPAPEPASVMQVFNAPMPAPTKEPAVWVWPLEGEIIGEYAPSTAAWSSTLGQWQTHPAIDIAGNPGEAVRACSDGTVADAWQDALWGNVLSIEHPDGFVSTYANLNTLNMVQVGQTVAAGDIISAVGKSAACESGMPWHLHFMLEKDGVPEDFRTLVPEE